MTDYLSKASQAIKLADEAEGTASERNWEASRYVYEATSNGIRQREIADATGKSQAHISRLRKCWEIRVVNQGLRRPVYAELGSFYQFYNSPEVHGESSRGEVGSGDGERRERSESSDYTTAGLVLAAWKALDALARNPAHMETITDDDLERVESMKALIRRILRQASLRRV
jgi:hypothetical protein